MTPVVVLPRFLVLAIGVVVLLGVMILLMRPRTRPIVRTLLLLVVLVIAGFILVRRIAFYTPQPMAQDTWQNQQAPPAIWSEGLERQFRADIYPSAEQAAYAGGQVLGEHLLAHDPNILIQVRSALPSLSPRLLDQVVKGVTQMGMVARISHSPPEPSDENTKQVQLLVSQRFREEYNNHGIVIGIAPPYSDTCSGEVIYEDVPWLTQSASYLNQLGHQYRAVVYSTESCNTATQADAQAIAQARQLLSQIFARRGHSKGVILQVLNDHDFILDRFAQSFEGSAGRIWRQALLLDTSPETFDLYAGKAMGVVETQHKRLAELLASALGLGVIILILYIFLNAATRGYYTWALRIAAVLLSGAMVAVFLLLR